MFMKLRRWVSNAWLQQPFPWHPFVLLGWENEVEATDALEENAKRALRTAEMVTLRGVGTTHARL